MKTILVVDDQRSFREVVCKQLNLAGFETVQAENGLEAITLFDDYQPDLILLDIDMPEMDGFEVCRIIRQKSNVPVLFLSGMSDTEHKERGFDLDATDYITKDVDRKELIARVRRWTRSQSTSSISNEEISDLCVGTLRLDRKSRQYVYSNSTQITLSKTEFGIITKLASNPHKVWSPTELSSKYSGNDVVRQHVRRIRRTFSDSHCANPIETIHGRGYRLATEK